MSLTREKIRLIVSYAAPIIFDNEGSYGSVKQNDNGAVSIGKMQWHGNRALNLLKTVCTADTTQAKSILSNMFLNEVVSAASNAWTKRTVNATEATAISALLITAEGRLAQDNLADVDITTYINKGISYGLSDCGALIYFADGVNQYGTASALWKDIAEKALTGAGDVADMYSATKALTTNYIARRTKVYNAVIALNIKPSGGQEAKSMEYTAKGLAEYALYCLALNTRYMWGSFGQKITTTFINSKKAQYPDWYTAAKVAALNMLVNKDYYGFDCVGLIKSYYWGGHKNLKYVSTQDKSANGMLAAASVKGDIDMMPEVPGLCVWLDGHIGVYIGGGFVIESTPNTKFGDGVCKTNLSDRKWLKWLQCPYIDYTGTSTGSHTNSQNNTSESTVAANYTVKSGDSLWVIASKLLDNGVRYNEIMALNGLATDTIRPGQVLKIPAK